MTPRRPAASADKRTLIVPIVIITVGVGWLLTTLNVTPGIDWILPEPPPSGPSSRGDA